MADSKETIAKHSTFQLPINASAKMSRGDAKEPISVVEIQTRTDVLNTYLGGWLGGVYKSWLYAFVYAGLALAALTVHWALAAVLAYKAGEEWSKYVYMHVVSVHWYKSKSLMSTE